MSESLPNGDEFCECKHQARLHIWATFEGGKIVNQPSKCRVFGCYCCEFRAGESPAVIERRQGDEMFRALQMNGITGDVASWLVDLVLLVRRLEERF